MQITQIIQGVHNKFLIVHLSRSVNPGDLDFRVPPLRVKSLIAVERGIGMKLEEMFVSGAKTGCHKIRQTKLQLLSCAQI